MDPATPRRRRPSDQEGPAQLPKPRLLNPVSSISGTPDEVSPAEEHATKLAESNWYQLCEGLRGTLGTAGQIQDLLQEALDTTQTYAEEVGLSCAAEKSELLVVRSRAPFNKKEPEIDLHLKGLAIPQVNKLRVLRLHLQSNGRQLTRTHFTLTTTIPDQGSASGGPIPSNIHPDLHAGRRAARVQTTQHRERAGAAVIAVTNNDAPVRTLSSINNTKSMQEAAESAIAFAVSHAALHDNGTTPHSGLPGNESVYALARAAAMNRALPDGTEWEGPKTNTEQDTTDCNIPTTHKDAILDTYALATEYYRSSRRTLPPPHPELTRPPGMGITPAPSPTPTSWEAALSIPELMDQRELGQLARRIGEANGALD
ncbi:hypothetical protein HPB47_004460 [Ixodes persulcatus]|uniref:Uncharacterized protein n=1 Tax=Ixodes persulcatus TaxID=34615 RepID=A0AC60PFK0_IXOPE|nr:hypothetical protein HPB47_004460 [Ixodes persulcatus]